MNEIERISDQLQREHSGQPWHGSPLLGILDGITHTQAASRPIDGAHSIWELVLHLTAWKNEVRHRLSGARAGEPREGDWPAIGDSTAEGWTKARQNLDVAHRLLLSALRSFREENLPVPSNDIRGEGVAPTYYELLLGVLQHDVYHAGQIALLKKGVR
jgi:uncharacterized damage-inducible protein DinB